VVLFACFSAYATSIVDVRLSQQSYDKSQEALYVNIEVRVDNAEQLILAGQNYRIYYPSETLSLNQKGVLEHVSAQGKGLIDFDEDLGFANFSVELLDNQKGGEKLNDADGWLTIATLKFDVIDSFEEVSMLWGREGLSADYATAFVQIAEWKAPLVTSAVEIDEYIDFNLALDAFSIDGLAYELSVGPNPTSDFIELRTDQALADNAQVIIRDMGGKLLRTQQLLKGSSYYSIDMSDMQSASYMLEINNTQGEQLLSKQVVVAR